MSLYRLVVCNVPVSCKANGDRNQLGAWLDSDLIVELYLILVFLILFIYVVGTQKRRHLLWIFFILCFLSCLCFAALWSPAGIILCFSCFRVCSLLPCGHLLGKGCPLGSPLWVVFLCICHFPIRYAWSHVGFLLFAFFSTSHISSLMEKTNILRIKSVAYLDLSCSILSIGAVVKRLDYFSIILPHMEPHMSPTLRKAEIYGGLTEYPK